MSEITELKHDVKLLLAHVARIEARLEFMDKLDKKVNFLYSTLITGLTIGLGGGILYWIGQHIIKT